MPSVTNVDHVIESIDNALDDWTVSDDAMRWAPDEVNPPLADWERALIEPGVLWTLPGVDAQFAGWVDIGQIAEEIQAEVRALAAITEIPEWLIDGIA